MAPKFDTASESATDSVSDIELEIAEAADFELDCIRAAVCGEAETQRKSGLVAKLEAAPDGCFSVTEYSQYRGDHWVLSKRAHESEISVSFNSSLQFANDLKRVLVYHLLPQFNPFGRLRSFRSTTTYARGFAYLESYLFTPNGLDASPESLRALSSHLLNEALDRAKIQSAPRQYILLYTILNLWLALSAQELIPIEQRLDIPLRSVDTTERRRDIQDAIANTSKGWEPFSEEDLSTLVEHALFWSTRGLQELIKIRNFLQKEGLLESRYRYHKKQHADKKFESVMSIQVDGVTICGYTINRLKHVIGKHQYFPYQYNYMSKFKQAVDKVRDAMLIFVALLIGLRNSELGILKFSDVVKSSDGEWHLNVTRFKTSCDPNYFGDSDIIPLPSFIGEILADFQALRESKSLWRKGLIFEQVANSRESKVLPRSVQRAMSNFGEEIGVDSVHPHRFRKTIAEIIINRSERNIDLIRMLFGHSSYRMSPRYIARNPYLVSAIVETMEQHFARDFIDIVSAVRDGIYSGVAAEQVARTISGRPEIFKGQILRITIFAYVAHLLEAGEPLVIQRTGLGTYCVSSEEYTRDNPPPCLADRLIIEGRVLPDPSNCKLECKCAVVLESATSTLEQNIQFYSGLLSRSPKSLTSAAKAGLVSKLRINEQHLLRLRSRRQDADDPLANKVGGSFA